MNNQENSATPILKINLQRNALETKDFYSDGSEYLYRKNLNQIIRLLNDIYSITPSACGFDAEHVLGIQNTIFISGERGSGKTSLLFTLKKHIYLQPKHKSRMGGRPEDCSEDEPEETKETPNKFRSLRDPVYFYYLDPARLEDNEHPLFIIVLMVCQKVNALRQQDRNLSGWTKAYSDLSKSLILLDSSYKKSQEDARGGDAQRALKDVVDNVLHSVHLKENLRQFFVQTVKLLQHKLLFIFDDIELRTVREKPHNLLYQVLNTAVRYLSYPGIAVIIAGDMDTYQMLISELFYRETVWQSEGREIGSFDHNSVKIRTHNNAQQTLEKYFPIWHRVYLRRLENQNYLVQFIDSIAPAKRTKSLSAISEGSEEPKEPNNIFDDVAKRVLDIPGGKQDERIEIFRKALRALPLRLLKQFLQEYARLTWGKNEFELKSEANKAEIILLLAHLFKNSTNAVLCTHIETHVSAVADSEGRCITFQAPNTQKMLRVLKKTLLDTDKCEDHIWLQNRVLLDVTKANIAESSHPLLKDVLRVVLRRIAIPIQEVTMQTKVDPDADIRNSSNLDAVLRSLQCVLQDVSEYRKDVHHIVCYQTTESYCNTIRKLYNWGTIFGNVSACMGLMITVGTFVTQDGAMHFSASRILSYVFDTLSMEYADIEPYLQYRVLVMQGAPTKIAIQATHQKIVDASPFVLLVTEKQGASKFVESQKRMRELTRRIYHQPVAAYISGEIEGFELSQESFWNPESPTNINQNYLRFVLQRIFALFVRILFSLESDVSATKMQYLKLDEIVDSIQHAILTEIKKAESIPQKPEALRVYQNTINFLLHPLVAWILSTEITMPTKLLDLVSTIKNTNVSVSSDGLLCEMLENPMTSRV